MAVEAILRGLTAWLLTYAVHSTLLLAGALLLARWLHSRRPALCDHLLKGALVAGFATATLASVFLEPLGGRIALSTAPEVLMQAQPPAHAHPIVSVVPSSPDSSRQPLQLVGLSPIEVERSSAPRETGALPLTAQRHPPVPQVAAATSIAHTAEEPSIEFPWGTWIACLWISGAAVALALVVRDALALRHHLALRTELGRGALRERLDGLLESGQVGRPVVLSIAPRAAVPLSFGLRRSEIALPPRALDELLPAEQEAVLAHELAHLERRDPTWCLATRAIEALFFFQPLNRLARRQLEDLAEVLCDDRAGRITGRPEELAGALAVIAGWLTFEPPRRLLASAMARSRSHLEVRVRRLLEARSREREPARSAWSAAAVVGLGVVAAAAPGFTAFEVSALSEEQEWSEWQQLEPSEEQEWSESQQLESSEEQEWSESQQLAPAPATAPAIASECPEASADAPALDDPPAPLAGYAAEEFAFEAEGPAPAEAENPETFAALTLSGSLARLEEQIDALQAEIASLREEAAADASPELLAVLALVEDRVQRLIERRERLRMLAATLESEPGVAGEATPTEEQALEQEISR